MVFHAHGSPLPKIGSSQESAERAGSSPTTRSGSLKVGLDYERYAALLADHEINEEDKRALIEALWSIITNFVQLGFHVHGSAAGNRCPQCPNELWKRAWSFTGIGTARSISGNI